MALCSGTAPVALGDFILYNLDGDRHTFQAPALHAMAEITQIEICQSLPLVPSKAAASIALTALRPSRDAPKMAKE